MARALYGCTSADFTLTAGGRLSPGAVLTLWTARTGGTRITDLLTVDGTPITEVVSGADASIAYQGPDNDKSVHWADSGQGARTAIRPVDITGEPNSLSVGTVTTGAAGSSAAVTITGDAPSQTMNLTIPQGATGPAGASVGVLTTKGDLLVRDSGAGVRLPVGADNRVLTADASQAAGMRWATPTTRVGTGSPLGVVVPDFAGQEWVDTQQTLGARKWVATGTTAASWVVSDGRTPVWDIGGLLSADWALADSQGHFRLSRTPHAVTFSGRLKRVTASGSRGFSEFLAAALPSGFTPSAPYTDHGAATLLSSPPQVGTIYDSNLAGKLGLRLPGTPGTYIGGEQIYFDVTYATAAPWPTAAPV